MLPTVKLTKRQKKGVAFRERKHGKSKNNLLDFTANDSEDAINVPSLEDQVLVGDTQGPQGGQVSAKAVVRKGKAGAEGEEAGTWMVVAGKKRKKTDEETRTLEESAKRRRSCDGSPLVGMEQLVEEHARVEETGGESKNMKQRFILFLGNLKYTTTLEDIQAHFSKCDPPPTVRLLTPKPSTKSQLKSITKSKGCAFLEFQHRSALQQALKLHHSQLDGRLINVELTAGGGGKGSTRMKKLKERNKDLEEQRRKRQNPKADTQSSITRRFSTTSGMEQSHTHKKTWSVGDVKEKETQEHQKGSRKRGTPRKDFRTGMNAIPVG